MARSENESETLLLDGKAVPLRFRHAPRAKRITIRLAPAEGGVVLSLPPRVSRSQAVAFATRQSAWIRSRLAALPQPVPFAPGARLPILGIDHEIRHEPEARRGVWREEKLLLVSGRAEHLARRVRDYLREEARRLLTERAHQKAALLPPGGARQLGRISVRDTVSRWGSCSSRGDLSFSWRLILAPDQVFDYVVAHEVAHLQHLDHSARFWEVNAHLTEDVDSSRRWLRRHGAGLLRYG